MSSGREKQIAMSLRMRVAVWIASAVLVCGALLLAMVREGVRQALIHELDANLRAEADEILLERAATRRSTQATARNHGITGAGPQRPHLVFATARRPGPRDLLHLHHPGRRPKLTLFGTGKPESEGNYRVVESALADEGQVIVRVGTSLVSIHDDMSRIDRQVAFAALSVLLIAPLTGFVLATLSLRPITAMSEQTERLRPQNLAARLPLRGAGDELDRLAAVINNLLGRIAIYVGDHRGLMADAAHQLRTPLAAIRSSVEVILNAEENGSENRDMLLEVIEQTESLETLVNQLLLLAETEVDNLRPANERVQLDEMLQPITRHVRGCRRIVRRYARAGRAAPASVLGNRHHLRQVVNNLVDNAIKFTAVKSQGPRRVSIALDHEGGFVRLRIHDSGIGISPAQITHIFDRFYRADASRRSDAGVGGNGLGLSIVKSVVESHGGNVAVRSQEGECTTFTILLPMVGAEVAKGGEGERGRKGRECD